MTFANRYYFRFFVTLLAGVAAGFLQPASAANPVKQHSENIHGDFILIGNTLAQDCRAAIPKPVAGTGNIGDCGSNVGGTAVNVFWQAHPADTKRGLAFADKSIAPANARSVAILNLPTGATVTYARIFWSAGRMKTDTSANRVTFSGPGGFSTSVVASTYNTVDSYDYLLSKKKRPPEIITQGSAEVTTLVHDHGSGAYQVAGVPSFDMRDQKTEAQNVSWSMVVFYQLASEPLRNLTLFEGLNGVNGDNNQVTVTIDGFEVPQGGFDAKLGIVAYEGDFDITGDSLGLRTNFKDPKAPFVSISDAQNPVDNFFNATRSLLGRAITISGDLPQLQGTAGSMGGVDLDVVDLTSLKLLKPGDTKAQIQATSTGDAYYPGVFVTSISTFLPDLGPTEKTFTNPSNDANQKDGKNRQKDTIVYKIEVKNFGNDNAINTKVTDTLPAQVTYVPGTLFLCKGTACTNLSDTSGNDAGEVVAGKVTVRLLDKVPVTKSGDPAPFTIKLSVTINEGALGTISNQAVIEAQGEKAAVDGVGASTYHSGIPGHPNTPTTFDVFVCDAKSGCQGNQYCDVSGGPPVCTDSCMEDKDCKSLGDGWICVPPGGGGHCVPTTDLAIAAVDMLQDDHKSVRYALEVQNLGTHPSVATVTYKAPEGITIQSVDGKGKFTCNLNGTTELRCMSDSALQMGVQQDIQVVVSQTGLAVVPFHAEVAADQIIDIDLKNNIVDLATNVPVVPPTDVPAPTTPEDRTVYELSGGGLGGCSAASGEAQTSGGATLFVLGALALLSYRRLRMRNVN